MKTVAILTLLVAGCGSVDAARVPDAGDGRVDTAVTVDADTGTCSTDSGGYAEFFALVTDVEEAGICMASYTVHRGVNTFNCTCISSALCSQASMRLMAEGQSCIQRTRTPRPDAGADSDTDAGIDSSSQDGAPTCVPSACIVCVNGVATTPPGACM